MTNTSLSHFLAFGELTSIAPCYFVTLTFSSKGLRWLQGLAGTHWVLGWRVLPPLQTGQHGEVGTVLQPGEFCGQPEAEKQQEKKRKRGTLSELSRMIRGQSSMAVSSKPAGAGSGLDGLGFSSRM